MVIAHCKHLCLIALIAFVLPACDLFKDEKDKSSSPTQAILTLSDSELSIELNQSISAFVIEINGVDATDAFTQQELTYRAPLNQLEPLLLDGSNTLRLFSGERVFQVETFFIDVVAPIAYLDQVNCIEPVCNRDEGRYQISGGFIEDMSINFFGFRRRQYDSNVSPPYTVTDADGYPKSVIAETAEELFPLVDAGNRFDFVADAATVYQLVAEDEAGNRSEQYLLSNDTIINPALKTRIDNALLQVLKTSMGDLLSTIDLTAIDSTASNYSNFLRVFSVVFSGDESESASSPGGVDCAFNKPTNIFNVGDIQNTVADNCTWDGSEGATTRLFIGSIYFDKVNLLDLSINGDIADYLQLNLDIIDDSSNSESGLSVKLRALANQCRLQKVKVTNPDDGKDYWITEDGIVCSETDQDGLFSLLYGPVEVDGLQYASIEMEHFGVDGAVAVSVKDKQLFAQFDDDIHFGVGNFTAGGLPPSPLLDGLIAAALGDILQGMINQSLTEFVLPFTLTGTETGVSFAFEPQAFEVYTSQNQSAETSWFLYYTVLLQLDQTSLDNANFPEAVPSILGSTFTTDDLAKPNKTDNRHNFAIAINANFVNQFLAMLYRAGFFHQTLFNQTLYTGPGATNALGAIDDNRITIEPSAPAVVVEPTTTSSSSIQVQWPNLLISEARKDENGWQTELQARANLKASIRFEIEERSLVIGLADAQLDILKFSIGNFDADWFDNIVNIIINQVIQQLAQETIILQLPTITDSNGDVLAFELTGIESQDGGHLVLKLNVSKVAMPIP